MFTSCGKGGLDDRGRSVFRMNLYAGLSTLDPAYAGDQSATWMCAQLFNGLLELDHDLRLRPAIARSWELDSTGLRYTFHLRDDVWFHKDPLLGPDSTRRVVAGDFVYSFTRICDPAVASKGAWVFNDRVEGVADFKDGKAQAVSGFRAPDDTTLVITLVAPFAPFPNLLAMAYGSVVPQEVVAHYGKDFRSHPVGTGPFVFKSWKENVSLVLLRNPRYFETVDGARLPYLDAVHVRFIRERLTEFIELCEGRLDFVNGIDRAIKDEVFDPQGRVRPRYRQQFQLMSHPQLNTEFIGIQMDDTLPIMAGHPLRDLRVRQALAHGVDRQALVDYVLNGNGSPATSGLVPLGFEGYPYDSIPSQAYDPDLSARLLAEAGFPGGKGIPPLTLHSVPSYQAMMEFVQKSWERLGLTVRIDNMDGATLRERATKGEIHLWRAGWIADYPDPGNYLGLFSSAQTPPNGPNRMRFRDGEVDSLLALAEAEPDAARRMALYAAADRKAMAAVPMVVLYYDRIVRLVSPKIGAFRTNPINMLFLKEVRKAP